MGDSGKVQSSDLYKILVLGNQCVGKTSIVNQVFIFEIFFDESFMTKKIDF